MSNWEEETKELARQIRLTSLRMTSSAKASHIGSCLSSAEILATLYSIAKNVTPIDVKNPARDRIIISKGHIAAAYYSVLFLKGFIPSEQLELYCQDGSQLGGHVSSQVAGVELSTGSLGHGLPYGVGLALGLRLTSPKTRVFVVMSDGELDEGTTWESALIANHHVLENLVVIIDRNNLQSLDTTESTLALEPLEEKWRSFGWSVIKCNGHDVNELANSLNNRNRGPLVVIAETEKGHGVSFMANSVAWHYKSPSEHEVKMATLELLEQ